MVCVGTQGTYINLQQWYDQMYGFEAVRCARIQYQNCTTLCCTDVYITLIPGRMMYNNCLMS